MDAELNSKLLSALEADYDSSPEVAVVSTSSQKQYLERYIDSISVDDRRDVARILINGGRADALVSCGAGSVVNMDTLPAQVIADMYALVVARRARATK